jgi:hypothetical protein
MNTPNSAFVAEIDALRGDLLPSERSPRPIPSPETGPAAQIGDRG